MFIKYTISLRKNPLAGFTLTHQDFRVRIHHSPKPKTAGTDGSAAPAAWHGRGWQRDASLSKIPGQHLIAQAEVCAMRPINPGTHCAATLSEDSDFAHLPHVGTEILIQ